MGALKNMFSGKSQRKALQQQQEIADAQRADARAAQNQQMEILQRQEDAQLQDVSKIRRASRGTRLLVASESGFGGVGAGSSKLG